MNRHDQQVRKIKNGQSITIKRSSFKKNNQSKEESNVPTPKPISNQNEIINVRNKIVTDLTEKHPGQKLIFTNSKPKEIKHNETILIPLSGEDVPTMIRTSVCKYLINYKNCTHSDVHNYSSFSQQDLDNKSVKYITLDKYGTDYPIVSKFNLTYCRKCVLESDDLIIKSQSRGNVNFVSSVSTRGNYAHVEVPSHIPMDRLVYPDGDNIWVNLTIANDSHYSVLDLKDQIITTVPRKNYLQVFALPPPFEDTCLKFDDFGSVVFINTVDGYDDGFVITQSVDSESDYDHDEDEEPTIIRTKATIHTPKNIQLNEQITFLDEKPKQIDTKIDQKPKIDKIKLILPMNTVSDFKNNKAFFQQLGYDTHVAKYEENVSVNVVLPITEQDKSMIITNVRFEGYDVTDIKDVVICLNDELITRWSFIITAQKYELSKIVDVKPSDHIDKYITKELEDSPDESIIYIVTMLEKAYLQQNQNKQKSDIVFDYSSINNCKNISLRDLNVYQKSHFAQAYQCDQYQSGIYRDVTSLLIHLKYCSIIPLNLITPCSNGIRISFDNQ